MEPFDVSYAVFCEHPCSDLGESQLLQVLGLKQLCKLGENRMVRELDFVDIQIRAGLQGTQV